MPPSDGEIIVAMLQDIQKSVSATNKEVSQLSGRFNEFKDSCKGKHDALDDNQTDLFTRVRQLEEKEAKHSGERSGQRESVASNSKFWDRVTNFVVGAIGAVVGYLSNNHPK
jgi:hypothetical protein